MRTHYPNTALIFLFLFVTCAAWQRHACAPNQQDPIEQIASKRAPHLSTLLFAQPGTLVGLDIAEMNLVSSEGLPGTGPLDITNSLAVLDRMADRVQHETERHLYRFRDNPAQFENSPGFFRMLMLAVVLTEDFGIHYDSTRMAGPRDSRPDDGFFAKPDAVFLSGLLGPAHEGTCSSLPVLYVSVGRRLGYPLKLVPTKSHLFVRWESPAERFNIEATGRGLNRLTDDYYRHWPFEITPADEAAEGYLKSLTPAEELAAFLSIRGMCLREAGRISEAADAFAAAIRLAPGCRTYRKVLSTLYSPAALNHS